MVPAVRCAAKGDHVRSTKLSTKWRVEYDARLTFQVSGSGGDRNTTAPTRDVKKRRNVAFRFTPSRVVPCFLGSSNEELDNIIHVFASNHKVRAT